MVAVIILPVLCGIGSIRTIGGWTPIASKKDARIFASAMYASNVSFMIPWRWNALRTDVIA
jgi:hypothetical protein